MESRLPSARHVRRSLVFTIAAFTGTTWAVGRHCKRQQLVYQWRVLGHTHRRAVTRPPSRLREMGYGSPAIPTLSRQRNVGKTSGAVDRQRGLRLADD